MPMTQVQLAVDRIRAQLVDCATRHDWSERSICALTETLRGCVRRIAATGSPRSSELARLDRVALRRVIRFVRQRLDTKVPVEDIAAVAGLDRHTFERSFKARTGLTPYDYVIRCRIRRAERLLARTERTLAAIALDAGFACQSHLTTMFRKRTGTTPAAYRRSAKTLGIARAAECRSHCANAARGARAAAHGAEQLPSRPSVRDERL